MKSVKKQIAGLLEREYLTRDAEDQTVYMYAMYIFALYMNACLAPVLDGVKTTRQLTPN